MMVTTTLRYALCGTRRADGGCSAGKAVRQRRGHITNVRRTRRGGGGGGGDGGGGDGRTTQVVPVATRAVSMRSCAGRVEKR